MNLKSDDSLMMETDEEELYVEAGIISIKENAAPDRTPINKERRINAIQEVSPRAEASSNKKQRLKNLGGNRSINV